MLIIQVLWALSLLLGLTIYHGRKNYGLDVPMSIAVIPAVIFGMMAMIYR